MIPSQGVDRAALTREIGARRRALDGAMRAHGLDAIVVASEANAFYLTGYETTFFGNKSKPFAVILASSERPRVICHLGEATSVELDAIDVDVEPYVGPAARDAGSGRVEIDYQLPAADAVVAALGRLGAGAVGFEAGWHFMPGFTPLALDRLRTDAVVPLRDASAAIWDVRRRKSAWEIDQMRTAARAAEATHAAFAGEARTGMTERELNRLLRRSAYEAGAEKIGYSGIVAGVDRAPLGGPTDRRWERGQLLFADICLQLNGGYFADFSRVWASATPTAAQRDAYARVVDALERGRAVVRAGTTVRELAEAMIGDAPTIYARVGHGLGLEMPEPPSLSPQDGAALLDGEVLCIEPNCEVPGAGWLVSEEEVVVREDGYELLSPSFPPDLHVIGDGQERA
jgi:Xaa-Pro aminopeptidase